MMTTSVHQKSPRAPDPNSETSTFLPTHTGDNHRKDYKLRTKWHATHRLYYGIMLFLVFICGTVIYRTSSLVTRSSVSSVLHEHNNMMQEENVIVPAILDNQSIPRDVPIATTAIITYAPLNIATFPSTVPTTVPTTENIIPPTTQDAIKKEKERKEMCYRERDYGIIESIQTKGESFCSSYRNPEESPEGVDLNAIIDPYKQTHVTVYKIPGVFQSTVLSNFVLNLSEAKIAHHIEKMSEDGGRHDPRFKFHPQMIQCVCDELQMASSQQPDKQFHIWENYIFGVTSKKDRRDPFSTVCAIPPNQQPQIIMNAKHGSTNKNVIERSIPTQAVIIARRDDHNPFFQVSTALNTWIMMKALGWKPEETRLIHFDAGFPSPVDKLHRQLFSPNHDIILGKDLMGSIVRFPFPVLLGPYETTGPMMQHLNDGEPCYDSALFAEFRGIAMNALGVKPTLEDETVAKKKMVVTIITRRPYLGRLVQRVWLNEDAILAQMRKDYAYPGQSPEIIIQSIDFVELTLQQQMEIMVQSDIVIGMHGAGLVNVMWTRPKTLVVEIFPRLRKRWGYRNLCQFLGCDWHQFRGGKDTGTGDNASNKMIPYDAWKEFFDPLFQATLARIRGQPIE